MYRLLLPLILASCHALSLPSDRAGVLEGDDFDLVSLVQAVGGPVVRRGQRRTGPTAAAPTEDFADCDDFEEDGAALMQSSLRHKSAAARQEEIEDEESDESVLIQTSISQPVGPAVRRGQRRTGPTAAAPAEEFADCDDLEEDGAALMQSSLQHRPATARLQDMDDEEGDESVLLQTTISHSAVGNLDAISFVQAVGGPVVRRGQRRTGPTAAAPAEDFADCDDLEEDGAALMQSSLLQKSAAARLEESEFEETDESVLLQTSISQGGGLDAISLVQAVGSPMVRRGQRRTGPTAAEEECDDCEDLEEEGAVLMQSSLQQRSAAARLEEMEFEETDETMLIQTSVSMSSVLRGYRHPPTPTPTADGEPDCDGSMCRTGGAAPTRSTSVQRAAGSNGAEEERLETDGAVLLQTSVSMSRGRRRVGWPRDDATE